jgi:hypothetical protein
LGRDLRHTLAGGRLHLLDETRNTQRAGTMLLPALNDQWCRPVVVSAAHRWLVLGQRGADALSRSQPRETEPRLVSRSDDLGESGERCRDARGRARRIPSS